MFRWEPSIVRELDRVANHDYNSSARVGESQLYNFGFEYAIKMNKTIT